MADRVPLAEEILVAVERVLNSDLLKPERRDRNGEEVDKGKRVRENFRYVANCEAKAVICNAVLGKRVEVNSIWRKACTYIQPKAKQL